MNHSKQAISSKISTEDYQFLREQLGRVPEGAMEISWRNPETLMPGVVRVTSWVRNAPFPTLYWLSDLDLIKEISLIESMGLIKELEAEIEENSLFAEELRQDHLTYANLRESFLSEQEKQKIDELIGLDEFRKKGVGGVADWAQIRCLHMHMAYYLSTGKSAVARRVVEKLSSFKF